MTRPFFNTLAAIALALPATLQAGTDEGWVNTGYFGAVAIRGYDPVAYFTVSQAVEGDPAIAHTWLGAEWHFASAENRALFADNPTSYAPQYGGLCADGVAYNGVTANIDPKSWRIIEGKLYLNFDPGSVIEFAETEGFRAKADENWKTLIDKAR